MKHNKKIHTNSFMDPIIIIFTTSMLERLVLVFIEVILIK